MDTDTIIGVTVLAGALALLSWLVFWSRRIILGIAHRNLRTAREIEQTLRKDGSANGSRPK